MVFLPIIRNAKSYDIIMVVSCGVNIYDVDGIRWLDKRINQSVYSQTRADCNGYDMLAHRWKLFSFLFCSRCCFWKSEPKKSILLLHPHFMHDVLQAQTADYYWHYHRPTYRWISVRPWFQCTKPGTDMGFWSTYLAMFRSRPRYFGWYSAVIL